MNSGDDGDDKPKGSLGAAVPSIVSSQIGSGFHLDFLAGSTDDPAAPVSEIRLPAAEADSEAEEAFEVKAASAHTATPFEVEAPEIQTPEPLPPEPVDKAEAPEPSDRGPSAAEVVAKAQKREARRDKQLAKVVDVLETLDRRLARIERVQRETSGVLDRLRRVVKEVDASMARRQDVKKLKKKLDQLEVVELADDFSMPGSEPGSDT